MFWWTLASSSFQHTQGNECIFWPRILSLPFLYIAKEEVNWSIFILMLLGHCGEVHSKSAELVCGLTGAWLHWFLCSLLGVYPFMANILHSLALKQDLFC